MLALFGDDLISLVTKIRSKLLTRNKIIEICAPYVLPYIIFFILRKILLSNLPYLNVQNNAGYLVSFSFRPEDIFNQILNYTALFGDFFLPNLLTYFYFSKENLSLMIFATLFLITVFIGMIKNFSDDRFIIFYFSISMAILCTFNIIQGIRYIFGLLPLAVYFSFHGLNRIAEKFKAFNLCGGIYFSVLLTSLLFNVKYLTDFQPIDFYQAYSREALATYEFINKNISDDKIIFFFKPRVLYLNTNVYAYGKFDTTEDLDLADYVLFTVDDELDEFKNFVANSSKYERIYENEKFLLYNVRKN